MLSQPQFENLIFCCPSALLPLHVQARLFPGCAFVVGADTAKRIIDPRYYGNSQVSQ